MAVGVLMFANVLLVRYGQGTTERLIEREDTNSTFLYGRYEAYLELGDVTSEAEANRKADAALATLALEQRDITAAVIPIAVSDYPYVSYQLGNSVAIPDENNQPQSERVLAITITEDDANGIGAITLGLRQVVLGPEERIGRVLHRGFEGARDILGRIARRILPPTS